MRKPLLYCQGGIGRAVEIKFDGEGDGTGLTGGLVVDGGGFFKDDVTGEPVAIYHYPNV